MVEYETNFFIDNWKTKCFENYSYKHDLILKYPRGHTQLFGLFVTLFKKWGHVERKNTTVFPGI